MDPHFERDFLRTRVELERFDQHKDRRKADPGNKDVRERYNVLGRALQGTKQEESNYCNLLGLREMHLANLDYRERKNGTVDQDMCKDRRKEKHRLVNAAFVLDRVIPQALDRYTLKCYQEESQDEPGQRQARKDLDRYPNAGIFKKAPVETKNRKLAEGNGE